MTAVIRNDTYDSTGLEVDTVRNRQLTKSGADKYQNIEIQV